VGLPPGISTKGRSHRPPPPAWMQNQERDPGWLRCQALILGSTVNVTARLLATINQGAGNSKRPGNLPEAE
jgi:hypothetical protein